MSNNGICPICKGALYVARDVPITHPDFGKLFPCSCWRPVLEMRRLAVALEQLEMPPRLVGMTFDAFKPERAVKLACPDPPSPGGRSDPVLNRIRRRVKLLEASGSSLAQHMRRAKRRCQEYAENPGDRWLLLMGEPGSGKTHLAAAIANFRSAVEPVKFAVVPDFLDDLRATFDRDNNGVSFEERFGAYKSVPLLVLDDLGTESATPWAREKLYQLVNWRYNRGLPLVITTNEVPTDLDLRLHSRILDDHNYVFELLAGDYRSSGKR